MIILDTNVVSEFMGTPPKETVRRWLNEQAASQLFLTTISVAEICYGLEAMPSGRRQQAMRLQFESFMTQAFQSRILGFPLEAARRYGQVSAERRRAGKPISTEDAQIAAIALIHDATLATRNTKDFEGCGIRLVNPF